MHYLTNRIQITITSSTPKTTAKMIFITFEIFFQAFIHLINQSMILLSITKTIHLENAKKKFHKIIKHWWYEPEWRIVHTVLSHNDQLYISISAILCACVFSILMMKQNNNNKIKLYKNSNNIEIPTRNYWLSNNTKVNIWI